MKRGRVKLSEVHLPPEIISKILTFLPVKPLLRFRCVSKWWNFLIGSSDFTKEHLECSRKTKLSKKLVLCRGGVFYSGEVDQEENHIDIDAEVLEFPCVDFDSDYLPCDIKGCCRGLVLLYCNGGTMLWNPFTRTHHILPDATHACKEKGCLSHSVHGLGYDELHGDYKVVRVVQNLGVSYRMPDGVDDYDTGVLVFSLKSNTWRSVSDFPHFVHGQKAVFVNGALHYIVSRKKGNAQEEENVVENDCLIGSFDVTYETYQLVPQPDYNNQHFALAIGELGGYLCMIRHYHIIGFNQVWIMKEYGVGESWTELIRINRGDDPMHSIRPITYLEVNQVLLKQKERICCFDLKTRSYKHVEIYGTEVDDDDELSLDEFDDVCVCTESLVFLDKSDDGSRGDDYYDDGSGYDVANETEQTLEQN